MWGYRTAVGEGSDFGACHGVEVEEVEGEAKGVDEVAGRWG